MVALLNLPEPPDAVFCFNDTTAVGALRTLHERGVAVPDEIALAGFDDIQEGRFSNPHSQRYLPTRNSSPYWPSMHLSNESVASGMPHHANYGAPFTLVVQESTRGANW